MFMEKQMEWLLRHLSKTNFSSKSQYTIPKIKMLYNLRCLKVTFEKGMMAEMVYIQ